MQVSHRLRRRTVSKIGWVRLVVIVDYCSCQYEIDECESNPCQNGGTCIDGLASFYCNCTEDFVGDQCEVLKLVTCENEPCKQGATCKNGRSKYLDTFIAVVPKQFFQMK